MSRKLNKYYGNACVILDIEISRPRRNQWNNFCCWYQTCTKENSIRWSEKCSEKKFSRSREADKIFSAFQTKRREGDDPDLLTKHQQLEEVHELDWRREHYDPAEDEDSFGLNCMQSGIDSTYRSIRTRARTDYHSNYGSYKEEQRALSQRIACSAWTKTDWKKTLKWSYMHLCWGYWSHE